MYNFLISFMFVLLAINRCDNSAYKATTNNNEINKINKVDSIKDKISTGNIKESPLKYVGIETLYFSKWNTINGIPYVQGPGANLGATSFEVIDKDRIAYLSNATNEIMINDIHNGNILKRFSVLNDPRDFIYEKNLFYVLCDRKVVLYSMLGEIKNQFNIPSEYYGSVRLSRYNNATYLLHASGKSIKIESEGLMVNPIESEGWITAPGYYVNTRIKGENSYSVNVIYDIENETDNTYLADKKIAGVFVVGATRDRIFLDVQTFINESPVEIERHIITVDFNNNKLGQVIAKLKIPDCYYVITNKDFYVSDKGKVLNMVTSPEGAYIFSITMNNLTSIKDYPENIRNIKYHYNNNLLKVD